MVLGRKTKNCHQYKISAGKALTKKAIVAKTTVQALKNKKWKTQKIIQWNNNNLRIKTMMIKYK